MIIQINTDNNVQGDERLESYLSSLISEELSDYSDQITRIEVHLSDENGQKSGLNDKHCVMEARLKGRQPIAVNSYSETVNQSASDSLDKLKKSIKSIIERSREHR